MPEYPQSVIKARRRLVRELRERMPRCSIPQAEATADWLIGRGYMTPAFFAWGATPYPTPGDATPRPRYQVPTDG